MHPSAQRAAAIVGVAAAVALAAWAVARLLGVDLDLRVSGGLRQVGPADILVTTVIAGLAAWVASSVLARSRPALAISMLGPSYLADGVDAVILMAIHLLVGATLIGGFASAQALTGRVRAPGR
jgi:Family of unknown function (DUF6069)